MECHKTSARHASQRCRQRARRSKRQWSCPLGRSRSSRENDRAEEVGQCRKPQKGLGCSRRDGRLGHQNICILCRYVSSQFCNTRGSHQIWVGWIDISLTVTPATVNLLFSMLADASLPIRLASSLSILRIVSKGLKEPGDKLQLIKVLSLGQVLDALEAKTRQQQIERGDTVDEGEESYREALGRMLSILGLELAKIVDVGTSLYFDLRSCSSSKGTRDRIHLHRS